MKKVSFFVILALGILVSSSYGASYDTLPKGVNTFVFKQVMASEIKSQYNEKNKEESLNLKEEFTSNRLQDVSAYNSFSLGEFEANVSANVSAQGFGYGLGLTDHFSVYGSLPVYHIKTNIEFKQNKPSSLSAVQATVKNAQTSTALGKFVKDLTLQLPNSNQELLQSLVVNYYGYRPIGRWEKDALGDAEVGMIYRLTDFDDKGLSVAAGAVLPTGDADDPDSLQDIATGDGQYDAFAESAAGVSFFDGVLQFDVKGRYTYQFSSKKEVRWPDDPSVPLSRTKKTLDQKLGNKIDSSFTVTIVPTMWMNLNTSLLMSSVGKTTYADVSNLQVKEALEKNTDSSSRWARVGIGFSTVEAYKRKKFDIPLDISVSAQKLLNAKNTPSYERFDLDVKLYF